MKPSSYFEANRILVILVVALALAACGGPLSPSLQRQSPANHAAPSASGKGTNGPIGSATNGIGRIPPPQPSSGATDGHPPSVVPNPRPPASCAQLQSQIQTAEKNANFCDRDADCVPYVGACNDFPRNAAVDTAFIFSMIDQYAQYCTSPDQTCPAYAVEQGCQQHRCGAKTW